MTWSDDFFRYQVLKETVRWIVDEERGFYGWIYFSLDNKKSMVKIGRVEKSSYVMKEDKIGQRLKGLRYQTKNNNIKLFGVIEVYGEHLGELFDLEKYFHKMFEENRIRSLGREWFKFSGKTKDVLLDMKKEGLINEAN